MDEILCIDPAVCTLLNIQFNLVAGTLGMFLPERPDLEPLVEKLLRFDILYVSFPAISSNNFF
jgi:hypothetical protein